MPALVYIPHNATGPSENSLFEVQIRACRNNRALVAKNYNKFFDICKSFVIFSIKLCPIFVIFSIKFALVFVIYSKRWLFAILCHKGENTEKSAVFALFSFLPSPLRGEPERGLFNV